MKCALIRFRLSTSLSHLSLFLTPPRSTATDPARVTSNLRSSRNRPLRLTSAGLRLRFQPPLEVLHANFVLNHGMPYNDRDRRLAADTLYFWCLVLGFCIPIILQALMTEAAKKMTNDAKG